MKNTIEKAIISLSIILFITVCILSTGVNLQYFIANIVYCNAGADNGKIIFSKESGFYEDDFLLSIYAPTDEIYYTLDGSDPDYNSFKYESELLIYDATENPNVYSMRTDVTAEFRDEEVEQYCNNKNIKNYTVPEYNVDKCTVVKAVYYDKNGVRSDIEEKVYFVGFDEKSGYEGVGVISITADPEALFGYESGIYVLGATYDEFLRSGLLEDEEYGMKEYWTFWNANYRNRGKDWERESSIRIFDEEKQLVLSQNAGIRIQGGGSRGFLPKSLNIYAREEYGSNRFYYDFWNTGYYPKRMTLTTGGDDYQTKIKDRLVSELAEECDFVKMHYKPYVLFLNGEYWGFYYLTEKYDAQYIEYYYGIGDGTQKDDIIMMKRETVEVGEEDDALICAKMLEFITTSDMSSAENYQKACELIDIQSFIDYHAVLAYVSRCGDWPSSNFSLWRSENISEKTYEDGKWRWMLFDVNSTAMEKELVEFDSIKYPRETSEVFNSLYNNASFRSDFSNRLIELANTVFEKENVNQKISEYVELMENPMENHFQRFLGESNDKFYEGIEEIRYFFNNRQEYILQSISSQD